MGSCNIRAEKNYMPEQPKHDIVTAMALATCLIPGYIERGVRLGSDSSSSCAAAGRVLEFANLGMWKSENVGI